MRGKILIKDEQMPVQIPGEICKLYKLKPGMEFEVRATERPNSKLLLSFICDLEK